MFPHPQNMLTIRSIEREQILANAERKHRHAGPGLPGRSRAPKLPFLRRAARALSLLVG